LDVESDFVDTMRKNGTLEKMLNGDREAIIDFYQEYARIQTEAVENDDLREGLTA
jgi:hypothetical protein